MDNKFSKLSVNSPPFIPKYLTMELDSSNNEPSIINDSDTVDTITQTNVSQYNIIQTKPKPRNYYFEYDPIIDIPNYNDVWKVYVTNINSLENFYVQSTKYLKYIGTIFSALELDNYNFIPLNKLPRRGTLVAARNKNGLWCRAKIEEKNETRLIVNFIDFGIIEEVNRDVKYLPKELKKIKPMVCRCFLKCISMDIEQLMFNSYLYDAIIKYFEMNEFTITFFNDTEPYIVDLSCDGVQVQDILARLIWDGIYPGLAVDDNIELAKHKMLNEMKDLTWYPVECIAPINSAEHFYVETNQSRAIDEEIKKRMENLSTELVAIERPKVGDVVIAKNSQDSMLCRARIAFSYDELYVCYLIDRGTFDYCSELYCIDDDYLRTEPPVKIHCGLRLPRKLRENLQYTTNAFINAFGGENISKMLMYVTLPGSPCIIDLMLQGTSALSIIHPTRVRVIHVESPNMFEARINTLEARKIHDVLKVKRVYRPVFHPKLHENYVMNHQGEFKRVKYMGLCAYDSSVYNVLLLDEQHKHLLTDTLFQLPGTIRELTVLDIRCSLGLEDDDINYTKKFIAICRGGKTKFTMVKIKEDSDNIHHVQLFHDNKDIKTMIVKKDYKAGEFNEIFNSLSYL